MNIFDISQHGYFFIHNKKENMQQQITGSPRLIDHLLSSQNLKNDAALSRALDLPASVICKLRSGRMNVSSTIILNIHETFDIPVKTIRSLIGQ